jgi:hypothetical protein
VSERVVFSPLPVPVSIAELGRTSAGLWGVVGDAQLREGGDALQLLYLSPPEYHHAVRGLAGDAVAGAIDHRRSTFSADVPGQAIGIVERRVRDCIRATGERGAALREDLLIALASYAAVPRFAGTEPLVLLDYLREGDARIIAELDSPSLQAVRDLDPGGGERAARRGMASALGQLAARRGKPEKAHALPYFDVERAYLITPLSAQLVARAHDFHDPTYEWRGGIIMPVAEREIAELAVGGRQAMVMFPTRGLFVGAMSALTGSQLEVELSERLTAPGYADYLTALRLQQATLRAAVRLVAGADAELERLLTDQTRDEAAALGRWLEPRNGEVSTEIAAAVADAQLLATLCRRSGREGPAARLEALARALGYVADEA